MGRRKTADYEGMKMSQLRKTYVEKCRQLNNYMDKHAPNGK